MIIYITIWKMIIYITIKGIFQMIMIVAPPSSLHPVQMVIQMAMRMTII